MFFMVGCAAKKPTLPPVTEPIVYLKDLCDRYQVNWRWDSDTQVVVLNDGDVTARALVGSNIVLFEHEKINLTSSLKLVGGSITVPRDFRPKIIERFRKRQVRRIDYSIRKIREIIIDAGHGGKDPGAIGRSGIYEKKVVLGVAKELRSILVKNGIKVRMTRNSDTFISLKERTVIASKSKADLFISIHANAHARRSVHGVEVYSLKDLNMFEKKEAQRRSNHKTMFRHLSIDQKDKDLKKIVTDMLYSYKQAESRQLADKVSRKIADYLKARNLGAKKSRFYVLRNTIIPAILVEVGYLSNPKEEKLLKTREYRKKVAHAIARSILDYAKKRN